MTDTLAAFLAVAAQHGDNVVASYMAAKVAEEAAQDAVDSVTGATVDETKTYLGID